MRIGIVSFTSNALKSFAISREDTSVDVKIPI